MRARSVAVSAALALTALAACAPTVKMLSSWKAPTFQEGSVKKVLVLGIAPDSALRRQFEDVFAAEFRARKVDSVPGYPWFPEPRTVAKDAAAEKVKAEHVSHVVVTRIVDKKSVQEYHPPVVMTAGVGYPGYYGSWGSYWSVGYSTAVSPGYISNKDVVCLETNVYEVATGAMVWTGMTETWVEGEPHQNVDAVIRRVVYELRQARII